jgi:hypothetical protein
MRLLILLLMGIIPELALCQHKHLLKKHPCDTLGKYSYLIVTLHIDSRQPGKKKLISNGTGFFIRQKDSLYLISARHVFTGFDVYGSESRPDTPNALIVWYWDIKQQLQSRTIPLPAELINESRRAAGALPDVDTLNVTGDFADGKINSVERFLPRYLGSPDTLLVGDTVIAFGYPDRSGDQDSPRPADTVLAHLNHEPVGFVAYCIEMPEFSPPYINDGMIKFYYAIKPGLPHGVSGAPIFKISWVGTDNPVVKFVGIQSGTKGNGKNSTIVKGSLLPTLYNIK